MDQELIDLLCDGIAKAEGYGPPENLPTRINNPGDLEIGDLGWGTTQGKTNFPTYEMGRAKLFSQGRLMLTGTSREYRLSDSLFVVAQKYTGGDNPLAWAEIVVSVLLTKIPGVTIHHTLYDLTQIQRVAVPGEGR